MMYIFDLSGVAVFAVTGAMIAGRKKMDVFGILVVASVTALGGGTVRDLVIGTRPVFWVDDPLYVVIAAAAGIGTFVYVYFAEPPAKTLLIADAFGLAIFTVVGCQKAWDAGVSSLIIIFMGVVTGVTGGMIRDILCGEIPLILRQEIYATASLAGAVVWVILYSRVGGGWGIVAAAGITTLAIRLISLRWRLSLPVFAARKKK